MSGYRLSGSVQEYGRVRWAPGFNDEEAKAVRAWAQEHDLPVTTAISKLVLEGIGYGWKRPARNAVLPPQQAKVLELLNAGRTKPQIATALRLKINHVHVVVNNLRRKGVLPPAQPREPFTEADIKRMLEIMESGVTEAKLVAKAMGRRYSGALWGKMRIHGSHLLPGKREYASRSGALMHADMGRQPWKPGDPKPNWLKKGQAA